MHYTLSRDVLKLENVYVLLKDVFVGMYVYFSMPVA